MTVLRKHGVWLVLAMIAGIVGAWLVYMAKPIAYGSTTQVDVESHVVANTTPVPAEHDDRSADCHFRGHRDVPRDALGMSSTNVQHDLSAKVTGTANILSISCKMPSPAAAQRCAAPLPPPTSPSATWRRVQKPSRLMTRCTSPWSRPPRCQMRRAGTGKRILLPIGALLGLRWVSAP